LTDFVLCLFFKNRTLTDGVRHVGEKETELAGSMALWFESYQPSHHDSKAPVAEVHLNLWRHPTGEQRDRQFLDIGLWLKDTYELGKLYFFIPVPLERAEVEDLSPKMRTDRILSAVFNEVVTTGRNTKDDYFVPTIAGKPYLTIYDIERCGGLRLTSLGTGDHAGTMLEFPEKLSQYVRSAGPHYLRFRVNLDSEKAKYFSYHLKNNSILSSEASSDEFTELRFNEFRNLPDAVTSMVTSTQAKQFTISSAHCFLLRDMGYELAASHTGIHKMRRLEEHLWQGYLPQGLDSHLDRILVYHWKSVAAPGGSIGSFVALAKFRLIEDMTVWYVLGIIVLGAMGSAVAATLAEPKSGSWPEGWWGNPFAFSTLALVLSVVVLLARFRQPILEWVSRFRSRMPFLGGSAK
jgi:hypothetical protein